MTDNFKYWDDCVDQLDMEALWMDPNVSAEWLDAGETKGQKVHMSRDPDGQPFLTQTEMKAVADIVVRRHFSSKIDPDMVRAIAELESDRQPLTSRYIKKTKETAFGIMQILPRTAHWLVRDLGYGAYQVEEEPTFLYMPFINVYLGAAHLHWLSNYDHMERNEEFVVRAYNGDVKKATHKSTLLYWKRYISVKESLPYRKYVAELPLGDQTFHSCMPNAETTEAKLDFPHVYWDSRASSEDMEEMWNNRAVHREWLKSREKRGQVRFSHNADNKAYLSRVELKAVAEITVSKHFDTRRLKPAALCAIAEIVSTRLVDGIGSRTGLMGIDYPTSDWLYKELGYKAYRVESADDLRKPFVSMYFGTAYASWLSEYDGRERPPQFVVQAYLMGPKNVNLEGTCPGWLKFEQSLSSYSETKRNSGSCTIM